MTTCSVAAYDFGSPAGTSLVCTVWFHKAHNFPTLPQRLGIVYCMNRPCSLYSVKIPLTCKNNTTSDLNPQAKCLTEGLLSAASPKFAPGGDKLLFLSHDAAASSGVHHATAALKCLNWSKGQCCSVLLCHLHRHGSTNAVTLMLLQPQLPVMIQMSVLHCHFLLMHALQRVAAQIMVARAHGLPS